jgi:hypothetical protein
VKPLGLGFTGLLRAERELLSADGAWEFIGGSSPAVTVEGARRWAISAPTKKCTLPPGSFCGPSSAVRPSWDILAALARAYLAYLATEARMPAPGRPSPYP